MASKPKIYIPIATGTTAERDIRDRFADIINLKDYGAVGDEITDDTSAFNAFMNAEGGVKYIPKGSYRVSNEILQFPEGCIVNYIRGDHFITHGMIDRLFNSTWYYSSITEPNCIEMAMGETYIQQKDL